jgi:hypothetical protein
MGKETKSTGLPRGNEKKTHVLFANDQVIVPQDTGFSKYERT